MPLRSLPALCARLSRKLFRRAIAPRTRPVRRTRLELVLLEDRTLLTVLASGESWSDEYYDYETDEYHPATVTVNNWGDGTVDVSGGNGAVSVVGLSGPEAHYSFDVIGGIPGGGDVTWSGNAAALTLSATGSVMRSAAPFSAGMPRASVRSCSTAPPSTTMPSTRAGASAGRGKRFSSGISTRMCSGSATSER